MAKSKAEQVLDKPDLMITVILASLILLGAVIAAILMWPVFTIPTLFVLCVMRIAYFYIKGK